MPEWQIGTIGVTQAAPASKLTQGRLIEGLAAQHHVQAEPLQHRL